MELPQTRSPQEWGATAKEGMAARRHGRAGAAFLRGAPPGGRRLGWPLLLAGALGVALLTGTALLGENGLATWRRLRQERLTAAAEVEALRARRLELAGRLQALRQDPAALERIARQKYSMHREGEEIIEVMGDENLAAGRIAPWPSSRPAAPGEPELGLSRQRPNVVPAFPPEPPPQETEPATRAP